MDRLAHIGVPDLCIFGRLAVQGSNNSALHPQPKPTPRISLIFINMNNNNNSTTNTGNHDNVQAQDKLMVKKSSKGLSGLRSAFGWRVFRRWLIISDLQVAWNVEVPLVSVLLGITCLSGFAGPLWTEFSQTKVRHTRDSTCTSLRVCVPE